MRTTRPTTGTDRRLAAAAALLLLLAGRTAAAPSPPEGALVLSIDGKGVTAGEFLAFADALHPDREERKGLTAGEAAEELVRNRLLSDMARRDGLDRDRAVRSRLLSRLSPLWNDAYWNDVVRPSVGTPEEELAAAAPEGEEAVTVRQVTCPTRERAEEAARLVAGGADFAAVARERSSGLTASRGGLVGEVTRRTDRYDAETVERLFRMAPGEVTPVLPSRTGFVLLRVESRISAEAARKRWIEANREGYARRRERRAWEKAREELLHRSGYVPARETLKKYRAAMRAGRPVAALLDREAARVGGESIRLRDVADPAGTGTVHPWAEVEAMVRSKAGDVAVALEAERLGLPKRHASRARKEAFLRERLLAREYLSFRLRKVAASDGEVRERFDGGGSRPLPRSLDLSFIETRSPERARKALEDLAKGVPFGEAARRWSDGNAPGGRAGFVPEDGLDPSLAPVKALAEGEYTKTPLPVPAADGSGTYHVVARVNAVREGRPLAFEEADRDGLRQAVVARKRAGAIPSLLAEAARGRKVEILGPLADAAAAAGFAPGKGTAGRIAP